MTTPGTAPRTFREIRDDSREAIARLLALFLVIHTVAFLALAHLAKLLLPLPGGATNLALGAALFTALVHALAAHFSGIDRSLKALGARPPDPGDLLHRRFKNTVDEITLATSLARIESYVLPFSAANAFALADRKRTAVAVTEGALARLKRDELLAVVAHETAHLVHGDTRAKTFAYLAIEGFEELRSGLWTMARSGRGFAAVFGLAGSLVSSAAVFLMRLTSLAISRNRELRADASAVEYTRDPLALASALRRLEDCPGFLPAIATPLLLVPPQGDAFEGRAGAAAAWLSTHPPLAVRVATLAAMARQGVPAAPRDESRHAYETEGLTDPLSCDDRWWIHGEGGWLGPFTRDLLAAQTALAPDAWVAKDGSGIVVAAAAVDWIRRRFEGEVETKGLCPRCVSPLSARTYEGATIRACSLCGGNLVEAEKLARFMVRRGAPIPEEVRARARRLLAATVLTRSKSESRSGYTCPDCGSPMLSNLFDYQASVMVERCLRCGTLWLDPDELELLQALHEERTAS